MLNYCVRWQGMVPRHMLYNEMLHKTDKKSDTIALWLVRDLSTT